MATVRILSQPACPFVASLTILVNFEEEKTHRAGSNPSGSTMQQPFSHSRSTPQGQTFAFFYGYPKKTCCTFDCIAALPFFAGASYQKLTKLHILSNVKI